MTPKRIFILDGHPAAQSLTRSLAEAYGDAARAAGHEVRAAHLHDLDFDPDYGFGGYENVKPLEPVLERFLDFWREEIEGPLHSVNVMYRKLIAPGELRLVRFQHLH